MNAPTAPDALPRTIIIGAGMSGMLMAIKLDEAGMPYVIYEKSSEVGGTWRDNTYPGLYCDVPSRYFCYSFKTNADWKHLYPPGSDVGQYLRSVADDFSLRHNIRFGEEVAEARYEDGRWHIITASGTRDSAELLVSATGFLHHPNIPDLVGLDTFSGHAFHSARWDHGVELSGSRIGVIGNGSTGVQLMTELPSIAAHVTLFQRTPQWVLKVPNPNYSRLTRAVMKHVSPLRRLAYHGYQTMLEQSLAGMTTPGLRRRAVQYLCRRNLRSVRDPELRGKLTPDYPAACKRLVLSAGFYQSIQRPNVAVVTEAIDHIDADGVVTSDGFHRDLDILVLATGFDAHAYMRPMTMTGEGGVTLEEVWENGVLSYLTVGLPSFPNFFMLIGPHSPVNNQSVIKIAETQVEYIMKLVAMIRDQPRLRLTPTLESAQAFKSKIVEAMPNTTFGSGCSSWYIDKDGVPTTFPWTADAHRRILSEPNLVDFEVTRERALDVSPRSSSAAINVSGDCMTYDFDPELAPVAAMLPTIDKRDLATARVQIADLVGALGVPDTTGVTIEHVKVPARGDHPGVRLRIYQPSHRATSGVLLHVHSGGFILGDLDTDHAHVLELVRSLGTAVVSVDYRLAPENPYPAALDDCYAALVWVAENAKGLGIARDRIVLHGVSAGGGLCAALALLARDRGGPEIRFQFLAIPQLDDRMQSHSMLTYTDTPLWNQADAKISWESYLGADPFSIPAYGAPARASDLTRLPPAYISVMHFDPLRDEGISYATALLAAGVTVELHLFPGTFHGSAVIAAAAISERERAEAIAVLRRALQ